MSNESTACAGALVEALKLLNLAYLALLGRLALDLNLHFAKSGK